jgi:hypothetical protein
MTSMDGQLNWDRQRGFVAPARPQSRERDPSLAIIAQLRAFSLLLCLDAKLANELVEITLLRVWVATNPSHLNPSHLAWLIARLRTISTLNSLIASGRSTLYRRFPASPGSFTATCSRPSRA